MKRALLSIIVALFLTGCAGKGYMTPEWQPFQDLSRIETLSDVDISEYPDTVSLTFNWEYEGELTKEDIILKEEVMGRVYPVSDFRLHRYSLPVGGNLVFLVDRSASMLETKGWSDSLIAAIAQVVPMDSFSLVLFGRNSIAMDGFYTREDFLDEITTFMVSPDPDGSDLLYSAKRAAEMMTHTGGTIVLITDNSFNMRRGEQKIQVLRSILETYDVHMIVLSTGMDKHPWLNSIGPQMSGMYLDRADEMSTAELLSYIRGNIELTYTPPYNERNGLDHQVIVDFREYPVRRYASYRAPGTYRPEFREKALLDSMRNIPEPIQIHPLFLMGIRIPFGEIGRDKLSRTAKALLDSVVTVLDATGDLPSIVIEGHTCDIGSRDFNMRLGERRAEAAMDYLRSKTGEKLNIENRSQGPDIPIVPNDTEEHRQLNRRAEIRFILPENEAVEPLDISQSSSEKSDSLH